MEEQVFDLEKIVTAKNIVSMYQNGNFLVCTTDSGQTFRHAIPAGKILNKREEKWVLEDLNLRG